MALRRHRSYLFLTTFSLTASPFFFSFAFCYFKIVISLRFSIIGVSRSLCPLRICIRHRHSLSSDESRKLPEIRGRLSHSKVLRPEMRMPQEKGLEDFFTSSGSGPTRGVEYGSHRLEMEAHHLLGQTAFVGLLQNWLVGLFFVGISFKNLGPVVDNADDDSSPMLSDFSCTELLVLPLTDEKPSNKTYHPGLIAILTSPIIPIRSRDALLSYAIERIPVSNPMIVADSSPSSKPMILISVRPRIIPDQSTNSSSRPILEEPIRRHSKAKFRPAWIHSRNRTVMLILLAIGSKFSKFQLSKTSTERLKVDIESKSNKKLSFETSDKSHIDLSWILQDFQELKLCVICILVICIFSSTTLVVGYVSQVVVVNLCIAIV